MSDTSVEVEIEAEARPCKDCGVAYPKNPLYYKLVKKPSTYNARCHECEDKKKRADGVNPKFPAKNGVLQSDLAKEYAEKKRATAKEVAQDSGASSRPITASPWLKGAGFLAPEKPTDPDAGRTVTEFDLNPQLRQDGNHFQLTINDYFKNDKHRKVPVKQQWGGAASSSPVQEDSEDSNEEGSDSGGEEDGEEALERPPLDPRSELHKDIATYPHIAANLSLNHQRVCEMSDLEAYQNWEVFCSLKAVSTYGVLMHTGVKAVGGAIERKATGQHIGGEDGYEIDLTGYEESLNDPVIISTINEICRENEELCEEYLSPEYRLLALLVLKAYETDAKNHPEESRVLENASRQKSGKQARTTELV